MATNKRKESAALFELIGKSTLKVPKNSGSLKIPSWWSNKANPAAEPSGRPSSQEIPVTRSGGGTATQSSAAVARPIARATPSVATPSSPTPSTPKPTTPTSPAADIPVQTRLFEPPKGNAIPAVSPSIRPPPPAPAVGTAIASTVGPVAAPVIAPKETEPIAEEELTGETAPSTARVFAADTHAAADFDRAGAAPRRAWNPPRAGSFARVPAWVLFSAIAGVLILLAIIIFVWQHNKAKPATSDFHAPPSNIPSTVPSIPPMNGGGGGTGRGRSLVPNGGGSVGGGGTAVGPVTDAKPHVFAGGTVTRYPDRLYIVICSTPSQTVATTDANFIADNGVDVSIETDYSSGKMLYVLVSVKDFPNVVAAEPFRARIVDIGRDLAQKQKSSNKNPWNDARARQVVRAAPATSAKG